jgi:hypothetical protein
MASNLVAYYLYRTGPSIPIRIRGLGTHGNTGRFLEGHHQTAGASRFAVR